MTVAAVSPDRSSVEIEIEGILLRFIIRNNKPFVISRSRMGGYSHEALKVSRAGFTAAVRRAAAILKEKRA